MLNSTDFRGLSHFPSGNAALEKKDDMLYVRNLHRPFDGVSIITGRSAIWHAALQPLAIGAETVIGATFQELDSLNRIRTVGQWAFTSSPDGRAAHLVFNSKLEGELITVSAIKRDIKIFEQTITPSNLPDRGWTIVASYDLALNPSLYLQGVGYATIDYSLIKSLSCEGNLLVNDVKAKSKSTVLSIDRLEISSTIKMPKDKQSGSRNISQVMLNGQGISSLEIRDEIYQ